MPRSPEPLLPMRYLETLKRTVPAWTPEALAAVRIQAMRDAQITAAVGQQILSHGFDPRKLARIR